MLLLRWCEASPPFDGRAFVYRTGPNAYEMDPYAGFIVPAGRAVAGPVRAYLRDSGAFADVVEPGSRLNADVWLEIHIVELYGDFREHEQPAAVLKLRMIFFDATNSNSGKAFLQKSYSRRLSIRENTAAAVVAGWNQALGEILGEAVSDLAVARRNS